MREQREEEGETKREDWSRGQGGVTCLRPRAAGQAKECRKLEDGRGEMWRAGGTGFTGPTDSIPVSPHTPLPEAQRPFSLN